MVRIPGIRHRENLGAIQEVWVRSLPCWAQPSNGHRAFYAETLGEAGLAGRTITAGGYTQDVIESMSECLRIASKPLRVGDTVWYPMRAQVCVGKVLGLESDGSGGTDCKVDDLHSGDPSCTCATLPASACLLVKQGFAPGDRVRSLCGSASVSTGDVGVLMRRNGVGSWRVQFVHVQADRDECDIIRLDEMSDQALSWGTPLREKVHQPYREGLARTAGVFERALEGARVFSVGFDRANASTFVPGSSLTSQLARLLGLDPNAPDDVIFATVEKAWNGEAGRVASLEAQVVNLQGQYDMACRRANRAADANGLLRARLVVRSRENTELHAEIARMKRRK